MSRMGKRLCGESSSSPRGGKSFYEYLTLGESTLERRRRYC